LVYLLTGSLLAVFIAHLLVDVLAYVSAANVAEDAEMETEAAQPARRQTNPLR
jgi:hypothetical protein